MQQPATKDQCAEALQGYQDSVGLSGISTSKSNTPAAIPNVSSSNFPYYGRSSTCCGGCLDSAKCFSVKIAERIGALYASRYASIAKRRTTLNAVLMVGSVVMIAGRSPAKIVLSFVHLP